MPSLTILKINPETLLDSTALSTTLLSFAKLPNFKIIVLGKSGHKNEVVAGLQSLDCKAIGISGVDLGIMTQNLAGAKNGNLSVNPGPVFSFIRQEIVVVFEPFSYGEKGTVIPIEPEIFTTQIADSLAGFAEVEVRKNM